MGAWEDRLVAGRGGALVAAPVVPPLGGEAVISVPGVGVHDRAGLEGVRLSVGEAGPIG